MSEAPASKRAKTAGKKKTPISSRVKSNPNAKSGIASSSSSAPVLNYAELARINPRFYEPPATFNARYFSSKHFFKLFVDHFRDGIVTSPTYLSLDNMMDMGIESMLDIQGWRAGLIKHRSYSPLLVRMFYANMVMRSHSEFSKASDIAISTWVLGKEVNVNLETMCRILGVPNDGLCQFSDRGSVRAQEEMHPTSQWYVVGGPDAKVNKPIPLHFLDPLRLVLWHIVTKIVLPRVGNLSEVKCVEVWVIANLIRGHKLNLGYLILSLLSKSKIVKGNNLRVHLPYAHLIMDILEDQGIIVPPTNEFQSDVHCFNKSHVVNNLKVILDSSGRITFASNQRLRKKYLFIRDLDNEARSGMVDELTNEGVFMDEDVEEEEESDDEFGASDDDMDIDMLGSKMKNLQVQVQGVHSRVDEVHTRLDGMEEIMGAQSSRIDHLHTRFDDMEAFNRMMYEDIMRRLPPPPPQ